MDLHWVKCEGDKWCPFLTVNLAHQHFNGLRGVYIIWHGGQTPWTVYVGQGEIAERLAAHRLDPDILQYSGSGLFVTWAEVDVLSRDGVELFLGQQLRPRAAARFPQAMSIPVNLPW